MRKYLLTALSLIMLAATGANAQLTEPPLRKASLGVGAQKARGGLEIVLVVEGSNAERMGIKVSDLLTSLNGVDMREVEDLIETAGTLRTGDNATVTFIRQGKETEETAQLTAKRVETFEHGTTQLHGVKYNGGTLGASLVTPNHAEKPGVVFYIQGLACASMETYGAGDPNGGFFEDLLAAGHAVWRVEKPGMGDSAGTPGCSDVTYPEEVEAFRAGYRALRQMKGIDKDRIVLFGHSQGGLIAPELAAEFDPYGTVVFGTLFSSWAEYRFDLARYQPVMLGNRTAKSSFAHAERMKEAIFEIFRGTPASEDSRKALCRSYGCTDDGLVWGRNPAFWRTLETADFIGHWARVDTPVLSLAGESDVAIISDRDQRLIPLMTAAPDKATFQVAKGINHFMAQVGSPEEVYAMRKAGTHRPVQFRYRSPDPDFGPTVGAYTVDWIKNLDG